MEAEDIDEPDGAGGGRGPQGPGAEEGEGRGGSEEREEEDMVTLDSQRIFLLMRKEYRSPDLLVASDVTCSITVEISEMML